MLIKHDTWAEIRYFFSSDETDKIRAAMDRGSISETGYRIKEKELDLAILAKLTRVLWNEENA